VLVSVLFADLLFLLLGGTSTSRAVLVSVLFADLLFLLLGVTSARLDPGRSARNVELMRVDGG
jgi:hypothetical protein